MPRQVTADSGSITSGTGAPAGSAWRSQFQSQPRPLAATFYQLAATDKPVQQARRHAGDFLGRCQGISRDTAESTGLVVCELVTNAVVHTGQGTSGTADPASTVTLSIRYFPRGLLIEVHDHSDSPPVSRFTCADTEYGRGLMIVSALSKEWSYFCTHDGKVVWCFLEITQ